jgi:hypothetical protein
LEANVVLQQDPNTVISLAIVKWLGIFAVVCSLVTLLVAFIQGAPVWCYLLLVGVDAVGVALVILVDAFEPRRSTAQPETSKLA